MNKEENGVPERIRTSDLLVRSQALYPTELRVRIEELQRRSVSNPP